MPVSGESFGRERRLRRRCEFQRVMREGRRVEVDSFVVLTRVRTVSGVRDTARLGITVSRRVGGSVARNRVKRCVREWFRRRCGQIDAGADLVVIGRATAAQLPVESVMEGLDAAAGRLGVRVS